MCAKERAFRIYDFDPILLGWQIYVTIRRGPFIQMEFPLTHLFLNCFCKLFIVYAKDFC
jgi:hypothetical protein